eukprot:scpid24235/ scgid8013/ Type I inositol 3,4-bisphosphate 4-phosphatase; Inositol polyphosphate 4-phosphatase type I
MKFDQKVLTWMANQACPCDKEACLWMLEKGFFRSAEYIQRWCRLKGNVFLYLKSASEMSEGMGAIILEGCSIEREHLSGRKHAIRIANETSGEEFFLAAHSEREASDWVTSLRKASFGGQRSILAELRDRYMKLTGEDPLPSSVMLQLEPGQWQEEVPQTPSPDPDDAEVILELTVGCTGLSSPEEREGATPTTYIVTEIMTPPLVDWVNYSQTEICQSSSDPVYFSTIILRSTSVAMSSRVRLTVFHVESTSTPSVLDDSEDVSAEDVACLDGGEDAEDMNGKPAQDDNTVIWALGEACTTVGAVINNSAPLLVLPVRPSTAGDRQFNSGGEVCLQRWRDDNPGRPSSHYPRASGSISQERLTEDKQQHRLRSHSVSHDSKGWAAVSNIERATFRFPCIQLDRSIKAVELMGESMYTWTVPIQLLRIFIDEDRSLMLQLLDLRKLSSAWSGQCEAFKADLQETITYYTDLINRLELLLGKGEMTFKPSRLKSEQRLEFVATNLHVQRIRLKMGDSVLSTLSRTHHLPSAGEGLGSSVSYRKNPIGSPVSPAMSHEEMFGMSLPGPAAAPVGIKVMRPGSSVEMSAVIDTAPVTPRKRQGMWEVITVGAPAAHSLKFRSGGLRRLLQPFGVTSHNMPNAAPASVGAASNEPRSNVVNCREEQHHASRQIRTLQEAFSGAEDLLREAVQSKDHDTLRMAMVKMEEKISELVQVCKAGSLHECVYNLSRATEKDTREGFAAINPEWVWNGKEFVKSATSSTDVTMSCQNVQQHSLCLATKVDAIVNHDNEFSEVMQNDIENCICNLSTSLAAMFQQLQAALTFSLLKEYVGCPNIVTGVGGIRHRRDLCFSQALTSIITAFISHLEVSSSSTLTVIGTQLAHIGLLVHWESLLSTFSDELGMLEDMITALDDLQVVQLRFELMPDDVETPAPRISGVRSTIDVAVPLRKTVFARMPSELRNGQSFGIHVVLFTQGINEKQLLADLGIKGGDAQLQDSVNLTSYGKLLRFFEKHQEVFCMANKETQSNIVEVRHLLDELRHTLLAKQPRNIDILTLSGRICRVMHGLRLTSCKSGKDRTAMSCTLEEVMLMKKELCLAPDNFEQALDVIRRRGTRLINTYKNIGERRYAFSHMQLKVFPKYFRPPEGTFGSNAT